MKNLILTLSMALLFSCGKSGKGGPAIYSSDPKLQALVELFLAEAEKRGVRVLGVPVNFGTPHIVAHSAGECHYSPGPRFVTIDENSFRYFLDEIGQEILIFHELAHCVLDIRGHDDTTENIMESGTSWTTRVRYEDNREAFLDDLFSRRGTNYGN